MKRRAEENWRRLFRKNLALARKMWPGRICKSHVQALENLTVSYGMSLGAGDLQLLENRWYVTHSGLLSLAERKGCSGIRVQPIRSFCDPVSNRWVFRAIVYKRSKSKGFVGFGDADPSNTSPLVRGAEMRVAETRAVNRALRKAYGIGLCSVEELGWSSGPSRTHSRIRRHSNGHHGSNGSNQRPTAAPRSTLPSDPPAQPRSDTREGLCRSLLRHRNPQGRQPGFGRVLHLPPLVQRKETISTA